jgi:hypothetical protein
LTVSIRPIVPSKGEERELNQSAQLLADAAGPGGANVGRGAAAEPLKVGYIFLGRWRLRLDVGA